MSPRNPVSPLRQSCLTVVKDRIVSYIERNMPRRRRDRNRDIDQMTNLRAKQVLQDSLPSCLLDEILNSILKNWDLDIPGRLSALHLMLGPGSQHLALGAFKPEYHEQVLSCLEKNCSMLKSLDFTHMWLGPDLLPQLFRCLGKWERLETLVMHFVCTDELLEAIGKNCVSLTHLDVCESRSVTEKGLNRLCFLDLKNQRTTSCCKTLKYFNVGISGAANNLPSESMITVLLNMTNLINFPMYPYTGRSLCSVKKLNPTFRCRLQFLKDTGTDKVVMDVIASTCPNLQGIYLDSPHENAFENFGNLTSLMFLKVHEFNCYWLDSLWLEQRDRLDVIELIKGRGTLNLCTIARSCINLTTLYCSQIEVVVCPEIIGFQSLCKLELYDIENMMNYYVENLLRQCPRIESLLLGECWALTDEILQEILFADTFKFLQKIVLGIAPYLTQQSVQMLIQLCPHLTLIGSLDGWGMHSEQILELMEILDTCNLEVTLL